MPLAEGELVAQSLLRRAALPQWPQLLLQLQGGRDVFFSGLHIMALGVDEEGLSKFMQLFEPLPGRLVQLTSCIKLFNSLLP